MIGTLITNVGKNKAGSTVTDADFSEGRFNELVLQGKIVPTDGVHPVPLNDHDAKGWKARAESLETVNKQLRTQSGAEHVVRSQELEQEIKRLKADNDQLQTLNAELSDRSVTRAEYENAVDRYNQLEHFHKTTAEELERVKALVPEVEPKAGTELEPTKKEK